MWIRHFKSIILVFYFSSHRLRPLMAAELVGGSLISAFLQVMFDRIASPDVVAFFRGKKSTEKSLQKLKTMLYAAAAVLHDADQKQIRDSAVKNWLDDLRDAVYIADDLIDEISTKAATHDEVGNFFCCSFNLYAQKIRCKIEDVVNRLESILKHKDILGLRDSMERETWSWRHQSTSLADEFDVFGRDNDKEAILELLLSDDMDDNKISVVPVVGMGGIGKTTLAQVVYNNDQVKQKFDTRAWVCITEKFEVSNITKSIIESINSHACDMKDLNLLQLDLKEKLTGKKFLIVLDDIWNENYVDWDLLRRPFHYGTKGSKILLTTRSEKVASIVQTLSTYHVGQLSDNDCWLIFAKHACLHLDSVVDTNLERIGKAIVQKCKGLPLVAKTLGGLLRFKHDIKDWNNILKSKMWNLPEEESEILPALRISYYYLSPQLKQCFLYCSMFPKGYEFQKDELILWWMAEGFLEPPMREKTLEEVGDEYFCDLVSRSFFQSFDIKNRYFVMHDLIHDLATIEARKFYYSCFNQENEITTMTRHLFCVDNKDFSFVNKARSLRTVIVRKNCGGLMRLDIFSKLKCMRVLSLHRGISGALPDSVNKLIHLRYLNLSRTSIKKLPDTLCDLYNLQTLILRDCECLTMLPNDMQNLVNLRYLDVSHSRLQAMPRGIGKLKNLCFLSDFVLGKDEGASVIELGGLHNLHNSLTINNLQHVANGVEASEARLVEKQSIEILCLIWNDGGDIADSRDILDNLQPQVNLKLLSITGYRATEFPCWLGSPLYHNIICMILHDCKNCYKLPPLGQLPSLRSLEIEEFDVLVKIGPEFYKNDDHSSLTPPFSSLESLTFSFMPGWQEWRCSYHTNAFPQLRHLTLKGCPKLSGDLPSHLPDLETLRIDGCEQLAASTIPRARAIYVSNCGKIDYPREDHFKYVESLIIIDSCDPLTCLTLDNFPKLQQLVINGCENLKFVLNTKIPFQNLKRIKLIDCYNLASFAIEGLSAPNMTHLELIGCCNMKSMLDSRSLPKLQYISLRDCPGIEWIHGGSFLPNLISLDIDHWAFSRICSCMEWQSLCSLTCLSISGRYDDSVQLFPEECLLPSSLTFLSICNYSSLETLDCEGFVHLNSLQELRIKECPKLQRITGQRLPASLTQFNIYRCSLLGEQCRKKNCKIWPKISHISNISVDNNQVC